MMKVLMIEDNAETITGLIDEVSDRQWEYKVVSFDQAEEYISLFDPDVVVMDWMFDAEDADKGKPILERMVSTKFRPVIVFSAHNLETVLEETMKTYPLIDFVRKGGDDTVLALRIEKWENSALSISEMRHSMNSALVESAKALDSFQKMETFPDSAIVAFMLSRRTIQYFEQAEVGKCPPAWIQYVYPPITNSLLVSDIIRTYSKDTRQNIPGKPEEYMVILTPSCDMINHATDTFKVLIGHCREKDQFTEQKLAKAQSVDSGKGKDKLEKVVKELQYGYNKAFVALPQLPNVLPYMALNLKDIDFVPLSEIANSVETFDKTKHRYYRVASIASPFREQIIWAHMINSCRPGMPVRDTRGWAKGILT